MMSEVEEWPRFVKGGYRQHRSQWVNMGHVLNIGFTVTVHCSSLAIQRSLFCQLYLITKLEFIDCMCECIHVVILIFVC